MASLNWKLIPAGISDLQPGELQGGGEWIVITSADPERLELLLRPESLIFDFSSQNNTKRLKGPVLKEIASRVPSHAQSFFFSNLSFMG